MGIKQRLTVIAPEDSFKFLEVLIKHQFGNLELRSVSDLVQAQQILQTAPLQEFIILDLDIPFLNQLRFCVKRRCQELNFVGLSQQPEHFVGFKQKYHLKTLIHMPSDIKDLAPDTWVGASVLLALNHVFQTAALSNYSASH